MLRETTSFNPLRKQILEGIISLLIPLLTSPGGTQNQKCARRPPVDRAPTARRPSLGTVRSVFMRFNCYLFWGRFLVPFFVAFPVLLGRSKILLGCPLVIFLKIFLPKGDPKWNPKRALERFRCELHRRTFKMQNQAPAAGRARFSIWTTS